MSFTVTEDAIAHLQQLLEAKGASPDEQGLRLWIERGWYEAGCLWLPDGVAVAHGEELLRDVYGETVRAARGPAVADWEVWGDAVVVRFAGAGGGLRTRDGAGAREFELLDADGVWHRALAAVGGDQVILIADGVTEPRGVRHAWAQVPRANLVGATGLPAGPFREHSDGTRAVEASAPSDLRGR